MVVLIAALTYSLPEAQARDERVAVAALPADPGVEAALADAMPPGFYLLPLHDGDRALFLDHPACRDQPVCLADHTPAEADLILDVRLGERAGWTVLEIQLVRRGERTARISQVVDPRDLADVVARDVAWSLSGWERPARLYQMALDGEPGAAEQLRARFPESPWTDALNERER